MSFAVSHCTSKLQTTRPHVCFEIGLKVLLFTHSYCAEWDDKEEGNEAVQQWEDDWDDDDVNDDFSQQLRKELEGAQKS